MLCRDTNQARGVSSWLNAGRNRKYNERGKARRVSKAKAAKAAKRTAAKAKPKSVPVKKAARKLKPPVAPAVETVVESAAVEMIEQPAPLTFAEVEEIRKAS
jgi:hypothetical protein